MFNNKLKR